MTKSLSSRQIIKLLKDDGWIEFEVTGDHHHFKHPIKAGKVTVQHPLKDVSIRNLRSIYRQAGLEWSERHR